VTRPKRQRNPQPTANMSLFFTVNEGSYSQFPESPINLLFNSEKFPLAGSLLGRKSLGIALHGRKGIFTLMRRLTTFLIVVLSAVFQTTHAGVILDEPVLGGTMIVATDANVTATYMGSDAGYINSLFLHAPGADARFLFSKGSPVGSTIDLGWFAAGTELTFRLEVWNTGQQFFTGAGSVNPDGLAHALAVTTFDAELRLFVTEVGFEDLFGGGDRDYNDFMFRLTNVYDPPPAIPEPGTLALLGLGLAGIGVLRRRKTAA
jgi:hypothetical protein